MWNYTDIADFRKHIKKQKFSMHYLSFITVIIIFQVISPCTPLISDKRLCYDPDCSEVVSIAKTIINYNAKEPDIMSFPLNVDVKVFSKSAGTRDDLWGVEIEGKRGYIPKKFLREKKVIHKDLEYIVPTEASFKKLVQFSADGNEIKDQTSSIINSDMIQNDNATELPLDIDQVSPSFEVIDGTTIYSPSETEEEENSYATKIINQSPSTQEQPVLSVHPNLKTSEIPQDIASTVATGALPESNEDPEKSVINPSTDEVVKENIDKKVSFDDKVSEKVPSETPLATSEKEVEKPKPEDVAVENDLNLSQNNEENKEPKQLEENEEVKEDEEGFDDEDEDEEDDYDDNEDIPVEKQDVVEVLDKVENDSQGNDQELSEKSVKDKSEAIENETVTSTFANVLGKVTSYFASPDSQPPAEEDSQKKESTPFEESEKISEITSTTEEKLPEVTETPPPIATQPELEENQSVEVEKQVSDEKETLSSEITEEISEKTNTSTETVPETTLSNEISSEQKKTTMEIETTSEKEPEKVPEQVTALPDVTEKNLPGDEAPKEIEKSPVTAKEVLKSKILVPIATVKKFSPPVDSEEIKVSTELPNLIVSQKLQEVVESSIDENIEEASGTTETSVQLELTDQTTELVLESSSIDLTTQTTQEAVYSDSVIIEDVNNVSKVNNVIDKDKLNDTQDEIPKTEEELIQQGQPGINEEDGLSGLSQNIFTDRYPGFNEFPTTRNLLNVQNEVYPDSSELGDNNKSETSYSDTTIVPEDKETTTTASNDEIIMSSTEAPHANQELEINKEARNLENVEREVCSAHNNCDESIEKKLPDEKDSTFDNEQEVIHAIEQGQNYWETLSYLTLTALTTLLFSLGYFYIENTRRDGQLIAKINKLEKELLISTKECTALDETLKSTKTKLGSIEDESFGSNEIVTSLKAELEDANKAKVDLENQVSTLEKDLESATEAGLELERMLRELLATKNEENPLAKTIEDLQARLDAQQSANKSLTSALQLKTQELEIDKSENDSLRNELAVNVQKCGQLELEVTRLSEELNSMTTMKQEVEIRLTKKVEELEKLLSEITKQQKTLKIQLKSKEMEIKDLSEVVKKSDINSIDLNKLSNVSQMKAEINQLKEERDDLKIKLTEIEGAHNLLEEHSRSINKEIESLTDQVKMAIKEKNEAETRLEVLTKFFQEKETERQKEENLWLQKQGEVSTTVEKMQIMQSEIQNYKQQIETLKREIFDQEKEYKTQIAALEAKAHEQWVRARQSERRLEESKAESGQLRNRLTLMEKNLSDNESEAKTHRLESNGETATSPQLFLGAETSSSPLMFTGTSSIPPPPYLYGPPLPPFLSSHLPTLPGYDVGQRPPPLGRLSSPPPIPITAPGPLPPPPPLHTSSNSRYDHSGSSPSPPISPSLIPHPHGPYRSNAPPPPPIPPFSNDRIPPVPLPGMLPPPHLPNTSWGEDKLSSRNNGSFHPFQRDQHPREYKGSLDISEESVDRSRRSGKL
ncbi:transport and Golgi organization protein 1 isoform X2 [Chelonus insularis]|uniref:transport and Golgi organization protein 1 isoform X2 n=1 Tax=Chelonus insularis TaxID=460826 RepID=UPI00158B818A|nr:transport and Golgi organization protein 1 isoform X2 [Chelonus insularis]